MRNRFSVLIFVLGFLACGTLAWAVPAGTGDLPVSKGLDFLIDKDSFAFLGSQAEPAGSDAFSKFSIKLYGGYNYMLATDVNAGSRYYFDVVDWYQAQGFGSVTGAYRPLRGGISFGGDLIYQITPSLGIGVGAGYLRSAADSLATFTETDMSIDITTSVKLSAVPIRLGLFLDIPMGGTLNLTANAGAAYYAGLKFDATQGLEYSPTSWSRMNVIGTKRNGADIGFHGSLGLEYKFSTMMGFFVEAVGRYAKLKNFTTVKGTAELVGAPPETTVGVLYLFSESLGTQVFTTFGVSGTPPTIGTFREPKFDLSGFSLQAGFRIHL